MLFCYILKAVLHLDIIFCTRKALEAAIDVRNILDIKNSFSAKINEDRSVYNFI